MFSTESKYGDLLVLSLPAEAPTIQGGQSYYAPGDFLHLNCSSYESKPAADLIWYINDQKVETRGYRLDVKLTDLPYPRLTVVTSYLTPSPSTTRPVSTPPGLSCS